MYGVGMGEQHSVDLMNMSGEGGEKSIAAGSSPRKVEWFNSNLYSIAQSRLTRSKFLL